MNTREGYLRKMPARLEGGRVYYRLEPADDTGARGDPIDMNDLVGSRVAIEYTGEIRCVLCSRKVRKTYGDGSCYPCFRDAPENAECIIRPELCRAHLGEGRDPAWEEEHHNKPHVVYLAWTSTVKVGVTGGGNESVRWMDQGAERAIVLAETPYRQPAGLIEVALKEYFDDRTNWRRMLTGSADENVNELLIAAKREAAGYLDRELVQYVSPDGCPVPIAYPLPKVPEKVTSVSFLKTTGIEGPLYGIKAQYLIFSEGRVFNVRRHAGFKVRLSW